MGGFEIEVVFYGFYLVGYVNFIFWFRFKFEFYKIMKIKFVLKGSLMVNLNDIWGVFVSYNCFIDEFLFFL